MANKVFDALLNEKIEFFKNSFTNTATEIFFDEDKKLIHPLEYGMYRETACRDFLKLIIPGKYKIDDGFIINTNDKVSTQCDIIIYDSNHTPLIESGKKQRFFPIETCLAIGEVKSTLSKEDFKKTLNKLSKNKAIRKDVETVSIIHRVTKDPFANFVHPFDQVFSFLICKKLNFSLKDLDFDDYYEKDIPYEDRHNMILSIEDGIYLYKHTVNNKILPWCFPKSQGLDLKNRFISPGDKNKNHFLIFASNLFIAMQNATVFFPEFSRYTSQSPGIVIDEE